MSQNLMTISFSQTKTTKNCKFQIIIPFPNQLLLKQCVEILSNLCCHLDFGPNRFHVKQSDCLKSIFKRKLVRTNKCGPLANASFRCLETDKLSTKN